MLQGESVKSESKDMKIMLFLIHTAANNGVFYVWALTGGGKMFSAYSLVPESFCILFGIPTTIKSEEVYCYNVTVSCVFSKRNSGHDSNQSSNEKEVFLSISTISR